MIKAEAGVEVGVEVEETGEGGEGEGAALGAAMVAVVGVRWVEVEEDPLAVAEVDVVEVVTLASGRRTSGRFTLLNSRRRRIKLSLGSTLKRAIRPNSLSVRFFNPMRTLILNPSFSRSWVGDTRPTRHSASQLFYDPLTKGPNL